VSQDGMGHCKNNSTQKKNFGASPASITHNRTIKDFFVNYVLSLGLLSFKFDLLSFEHNCLLFDMFRFIHGISLILVICCSRLDPIYVIRV
jgi:hypothetical protein